MIPRYTRPIMSKLWSVEEKLRAWCLVEFYACEAWYNLGKVPKKDYETIKEKLNPYMENGFTQENIKRIEEIEKITKHDVVAFLTHLSEIIGPSAKYLHMGMTSSDVLDTAMAWLMKRAMEIIIENVKEIKEVFKERAYEFKDTLMIGRTHGIHAEPITFGLKFALWYEEMKRNEKRLYQALEDISYGKISGVVGTFAHVPPEVEAYVCKKMGLIPDPISNQIIQRDRYAEYIASLAILGATVEKIATEIRHLQKTEILEVEEYFSSGQTGSSAMPHKKNPILSENLCGLARLLRGYLVPALENIALWHERDISHSSVERIIIPDATIIADFMLVRLENLIKNLVVHSENMRKNFELLRGLVFSQSVMLFLIEKGMTRELAYRIVQELAMKVWKDKNLNFKELIAKDKRILEFLTHEEIEKIFDVSYYLRYVDKIYERVFSN